MTSTPKVSVIIPNYNCASFIERAITSVLEQTEQDFEVLIGDDCSTDGSVEIVESISKRDNRVKLFINSKNSGPSKTRNRLIDEAKGIWIALLDADDYYQSERLHRLVEIAEEHNADFVADNLIKVDMQENNIGYALKTDFKNQLYEVSSELLIKKDLPGPADFKYGFLKPIIKRKFLNNNDIRYKDDIHIGEDFFLYLESLIKSARFFLTLEPFYCYRVRPKSLSRSPNKLTMTKLMQNNLQLRELAVELKQNNIAKLLKRREELYVYTIKYDEFTVLIRGSHFFEAVKLLWILPLAARLFFARVIYDRLLKVGGLKSA